MRGLRTEFPTKLPVRLRRRPLGEGQYGYTSDAVQAGKAGLTICLSTALSPDHAFDILLHEWAHARLWHVGVEAHDERWAKEYAVLRQWYQGELTHD